MLYKDQQNPLPIQPPRKSVTVIIFYSAIAPISSNNNHVIYPSGNLV